jgi:hypothetical protein
MYNIEESIYYNTTDLTTNILKNMRSFHNSIKTRLVGIARKGQTLIDFACGKGGDLPKWQRAGLSFVFGIDISEDNLKNRLDGSCARYLDMKKKMREIPGALFVLGNSGKNIKSTDAMMNDKSKIITNAVFGKIPNKNLDKTVEQYYGIGKSGFNISSCQFAVHYMFKDETTLFDFLQNVSECTQLNGYFIGTCYDGETIFNKLKRTKKGDAIVINHNDTKIWSITKKYDEEHFRPDKTGIGLKISVFQESINNEIDEYLVNFTYLNYLLGHYGFSLITQHEATNFGFPSPSNMFRLLYDQQDNLSENAKEISFLNRYFIFKKIHNVNAKEITNALKRDVEEVGEGEEFQGEEFQGEEFHQVEVKPRIDDDEVEDLDEKIKQMEEEVNAEQEALEIVPEVISEVVKEPEVIPEVVPAKKRIIVDDDEVNVDRCQCLKASGLQCTNKPKHPSKFCGIHKNCKNPVGNELVNEVVEVIEAAEVPKVVEVVHAKKKRIIVDDDEVDEVNEVKDVAEVKVDRCQCLKANGLQCTNKPKHPSKFCGMHTNCKKPVGNELVPEVVEVIEAIEAEPQEAEPHEAEPHEAEVKNIQKTKRLKKDNEPKTKRVQKEEKPKCQCIKADGQRCTANALPNSNYCGTHKNCKNPIK